MMMHMQYGAHSISTRTNHIIRTSYGHSTYDGELSSYFLISSILNSCGEILDLHQPMIFLVAFLHLHDVISVDPVDLLPLVLGEPGHVHKVAMEMGIDQMVRVEPALIPRAPERVPKHTDLHRVKLQPPSGTTALSLEHIHKVIAFILAVPLLAVHRDHARSDAEVTDNVVSDGVVR